MNHVPRCLPSNVLLTDCVDVQPGDSVMLGHVLWRLLVLLPRDLEPAMEAQCQTPVKPGARWHSPLPAMPNRLLGNAFGQELEKTLCGMPLTYRGVAYFNTRADRPNWRTRYHLFEVPDALWPTTGRYAVLRCRKWMDLETGVPVYSPHVYAGGPPFLETR